jgi:hypothetical protein
MTETQIEKRAVPVAMTQQGFMPTTLAEAWQLATNLSQSDIVPRDMYYQKPANCLIALDLASRFQMHWLSVMQHVYVVHGRPGLDSAITTSLTNKCGIFQGPIQYQVEGNNELDPDPYDESYRVRAYATRHGDTQPLFGPWITWKLVHSEKWDQPKKSRDGRQSYPSKWQTMPDQMFHYRAASWFQKRYVPEVTCGMPTVDEIREIQPLVVESQDVTGASTEPGVDGLRSRMQKNGNKEPDTQTEGGSPEPPQEEPKKPRQRLLACTHPNCKQEIKVDVDKVKEQIGHSCRCGNGTMIFKSDKKALIQDQKEKAESEQHEADKKTKADDLAKQREAEKTATEKFGSEDEVAKKFECSNCGAVHEVKPGDQDITCNAAGVMQCKGCLKFTMELK